MLEVKELEVCYGKKIVVDNLNLNVKQNEIVALVGHNGAGKTTILKSIMRVVPARKGLIIYKDSPLPQKTRAVVKAGISMLLQDKNVFDELSIWENMEIASYILHEKKGRRKLIEEVLEKFPVLKRDPKKIARALSGGERQILAIGMLLIQKPEIIILDEPSIGLSPAAVDKIFNIIQRLKIDSNMTIVIVEQKIKRVLEISDRAYVLRMGKVALEGSSAAMLSSGNYRQVMMS